MIDKGYNSKVIIVVIALIVLSCGKLYGSDTEIFSLRKPLSTNLGKDSARLKDGITTISNGTQLPRDSEELQPIPTGPKIFISQQELNQVKKELMEEVTIFINKHGLEFSDHTSRFISRLAKRFLNTGIDIQEIKDYLKKTLYEQLELEKRDFLLHTASPDHPKWQDAMDARKRSWGGDYVDRETFLTNVRMWAKERFGIDVDINSIKMVYNTPEELFRALQHDTTIFGTVIYRFYTPEGPSYLDLYHEIMHLIFKGFDATWLDEAMTEKLTKELLEVIGRDVIGEDPSHYFTHAQESLDKIADRIGGFSPLVISYMTGDEEVIIEALGHKAFQLIESVSCFSELEESLIDSILSNLESPERLTEIAEIALFYQAKKTKAEKGLDVLIEEAKLKLKRIELKGEVKKKLRHSLKEATYLKLEALSQDKTNPRLQHAAAEMLAMSEQTPVFQKLGEKVVPIVPKTDL